MASVSIDKITFPIDKIQASLKVHGIYAIPQEWKTTDEANHGLFTYAVRMSKFQIIKGKICPRELTQKQKKQLQQKSKKGGKKQSKNPQPNEEQQRIRKLQEQKQKQRQQLFVKMSEQEQFYYNSQDIYRSPFLKFEQNTKEESFEGNDCLIFQERLLKDKGDWIYIYKMPTVSEDELAKMRKTKPKTLANINDLNPVVMRAWVNFQELSNGGDNKIQIKQLRCKIHQVDKTPQTPEPNLQKTYVKVSFSLTEPIIRQKDSFSTGSLISDPEKPKPKLPQEQALDELKQQIGLAIESLAMEFSAMFWKDLNLQQDQRQSQVFLNNKKGDLSKRKQQFLYDFNVTGKYKILKDRIKKCIVHLCQTKYKQFFEKMKSLNGIKCNNQDQIYSQIYDLLVVSYQETIFKIIYQKQQSLGEVLVLNNETIKLQRQVVLNSYKQESVVQRAKRVSRQYELIGDNVYGEQALRKYIDEYPQIIQLKYIYGIYCLKYNLKQGKQVLPYIEQYLTQQKLTLTEDKKIEFMLILLNYGGQQGYLKGWVILREIVENSLSQSEKLSTEALSKWLLLASIVLKRMRQQSLSLKYKSFALREYKKATKQHQTQQQHSNHKLSPLKSQLPTLHLVANYSSTATVEDLNTLYDRLIEYLGAYSAFQLIKTLMEEKSSSVVGHNNQKQSEQQAVSLQKALPEISQLLVSTNPQSAQDRLLELTSSLYQHSSSSANKNPSEKNKILQLLIKAYLFKINYQSSIKNNIDDDLKTLQGYLKKSLMTNNDALNRFVTLLRLGHVYYLKGQFGNARACLLKYLQKSKDYPEYLSGLSYKLLGISCLKLQRVNQAIQNFKHWNLTDIKNTSVWLYLALAHAHSQQLIVVNQCLAQYKKRCQHQSISLEENQILSEITSIVRNANQQGQYNRVLKNKILQVVKV